MSAAGPHCLRERIQSVTAVQPEGTLENRVHLIKAVFGVSQQPTSTLSQLFDLAQDLLGSSQTNDAVTAAAAALVFLGHGQPSKLVLRQYVQKVFLPLAAATEGTPAGSQLLHQLSSLLADQQDIAYEMLQCVHSSLTAALQPCNSSSTGAAAAVIAPANTPAGSGQWHITLQLPAVTAAIAAKELTAAAINLPATQQQQQEQQPAALQSILQLATGPLFSTACSLLNCSNAVLRRAAFQQLLPALLQAAEASSSTAHQQCMQQLWQQCLAMIAAPALPRRMGLAVLLQYHAAWDVQPPSVLPADSEAAEAAAAAAGSSQHFWTLLRECLVDEETLNRKRALRLLQLLLPAPQLASEPVWGVFLALYELMDEFSPHLVKAAWPMMSQLHPAAPQFAGEDAEADVAHSGKVNQLRRAKAAAQPQGAAAGQAEQPEQVEQQHEVLPLAFCWSSVLWTLALQHSNLQVQRMAMKTLLKRSWTPAVLQQVPVTFFTCTLLPALMSPVHHKVQATAGLSATGGAVEATQQEQQPAGVTTAAGAAAGCGAGSSSSFNVITQAAELVRAYVEACGPAAARELTAGGLQVVTAPGQELPRSGLLALLRSLAAAAAAAQAAGSTGSMLTGLSESEAGDYAEASLSKLHMLLGRIAAYNGPQYRCTCYNLMLAVAAAAAPPGPCKLTAAARFIQAFPGWMQGLGGQLYPSLRAWLLGSSSSSNAGSSSEAHTWLADSTIGMWQQYFGSSSSRFADGTEQQQQQQQWHASPHDYAAWRSSCDAWLRVMLCCGIELQQQLTAALSDLADRTDQLSSRSYLAPGSAERVMVMLTVLCEGADAAGRIAMEAGEGLPLITKAVAGLAEAVAGPLGRCLELYSTCYWSSPAALAWEGGSSSSSVLAGRFGLSPGAWAAAARAEAAAQAAAAVAVLLARHVAGCWVVTGSQEGGEPGVAAAVPGVRRALPVLLQLLGKMAEVGEQLAAKPLPTMDATAPAGAVAGAAVDGPIPTGLYEAAAAEQSRTSALQVLLHASLGMSRSRMVCPKLVSHCLRASPVSWLEATLREVDAARRAHNAWLPAASAAASICSGDPMRGWLEGMDWRCCDATMTLAAITAAPPTAASAAAAANLQASREEDGGAAAVLPGLFAGIELPAGLLSQRAVCAVLCQALDALQWTGSEPGSDLMQLLRCLRRVWLLVVQDKQLQVAALQSLQPAGVTGSSSDGSSNLATLAAVLSNGLLDMLMATKKRPTLMYSLTVNALLLPQLCVFDPSQRPELAALHEGPGAPLKRFVRGLLRQGTKGGSTRLMLVLGTQLATFLTACPQLLLWYQEELRQLVLFGVVGGLGQDADMQGLPSLEEGQERSLLADPLDPELQEAYTLTDIGARLAVCCGLYQLAVQAGLVEQEDGSNSGGGGGGGGDSGNRGSSSAWVSEVEAAGVALWTSWLKAVLSDPLLCGERFKVGSDVHRLKVRSWQGLAAAANFLSSSRQRQAATAAVKELLGQLGVNNPPSIKQYQEAITTHLLLKHPGLLQDLLLPQLTSVEKGNSATGSHILIAVQTALHSSPQQQAVLLPQLIKLLLPWTNHHTHNIRTFSQLGYCALLDAKPLGTWQGWEEGLGTGGAAVAGEMLRFMHHNVDFQRFRRAMGAGILSWSPAGVTAPRRIFSGALHLAGAEDTPVTFEGVPETLADRLTTFLTLERAKLREAAMDRMAGWTEAAGGAARGAAAAGVAGGGDGGGGGGGGGVLQVDYQRKVSPSERAVLMADVLEDAEEQGVLSGPAGTQRSGLIVVASLISKVPNLGGLARTAEVMGAGALVLADTRVAAEQGFTSVSVTAERWVPLLEVKEAALLGWLAAQQAQGYTLVGLEQTSESTCLPSFNFPSKTVLVLGREKEGIPPEVIAMLDATVEIPQLGVIRSLNVHVSGAIAMYEYAKQQLAGK